MKEFEDGHAKDGEIGFGDTLKGPVLRVGFDEGINFSDVVDSAFDEFYGEVEMGDVAFLEAEEEIEAFFDIITGAAIPGIEELDGCDTVSSSV